MSQFRILDDNFAFDSVTNFLPTSADPAFPAANLAHPFRSRVWRSYGFFRITGTNNAIDFKDSVGGATVSVLIPQGEYTPEQLATLIGARMALYGVGSYTVTYSRTTGKWTIASSLTTLQILASSGGNAASGIYATLGFDVSADYTGAATYTGAKPAIHTEERMVLDLGMPCDVDSFALVFDPDTGHKFSPAAVLTLMASSTANFYGSPAVNLSLSADDIYGCVTAFFASVQTYRYWCVKIVDPQNPYLYVEIPKLMLCKATQLSQVANLGFISSVKDLSQETRNPYGNVYCDVYPTQRSMKFQFSNLPDADIETLFKIEARLGGVWPIGVAMDPTAELFDKDRFFVYGRLKQQNDHTHQFYNFFNADFQVEEAF